MIYSEKGMALTKQSEGYRLEAYRDSSGILAIGYGHTGKDVRLGMTITKAEADALLVADVQNAVSAVDHLVTVPLTQNQFDALVDFVFNLGAVSLKCSTLLHKLNGGDYRGAADEFRKWVYCGGKVLPGLVARREAEANLFRESA